MHLRVGGKIAERQLAVHYANLVERDGHQRIELVAPVDAFAALRVATVAAIDEVQVWLLEDDLADDFAVAQDRVPADGDIDARRLEQGGLHPLVLLFDQQAFDPVGATPPDQVDILDMALIVPHVGHLLVQEVAHQVRQGEMQQDQQQAER